MPTKKIKFFILLRNINKIVFFSSFKIFFYKNIFKKKIYYFESKEM